MKTLRIFCLFLSAPFLITPAFADTDSAEFMTPRDLLRDSSTSNISLHNTRTSATTVYGVYVREYATVAPGETTCKNASPMYPTLNNITAGAVVAPVTINPGKSAAIGSNYLYNMLYTAIYYIRVNVPVSPPGCALPGCTWQGDPTYNWCIFLGAMAPVVTTAPYAGANVAPAAIDVAGAGYDYNLINNYVYLGPITCSDQTLTCTAVSQQTQSF